MAEETKEQIVDYVMEDKANNISLTDASKSGFNDRAWNDPPPMLMSSSPQSGTQHKDTPRPKKLSTRVAFPLGPGPVASTNSVLDPLAPPPMMGFVAPTGAPPKARPPSNGPPPPPPSSS